MVLLSICLLLSACIAKIPPTIQKTAPPTAAPGTIADSVIVLPPQAGPYGTIVSQPSRNPHQRDLTFQIQYPQGVNAFVRPPFKTQSLTCSTIAFLKVSVSGINIPAPLFPTAVDGFNMIAGAGTCTAVATVPNVPSGKARIGTVIAYDATRTEIAGSTLKTVFDVVSDPTNVEISYRTTPNGQVVENILTAANPLVASHMSLLDLKTLIDGVTGAAGVFPGYTYTTHPTLVNTTTIANDLLANGGNSGALNPANAGYKVSPGSVTGTLAGLVSSDTATIRVNDSASNATAGNGNGVFTLNGAAPGNWKVFVTGVGGTTYTASGTPAVTVTSGGSVAAGTVTLTPALPTTTSVVPNTAGIGTAVTINGSNFHVNANGNVVRFGAVTVPTVDVTVVSANQLTAKVPVGASGTPNVTVGVGTQTSNGQAFTVLLPASIANFTPTQGTGGTVVTITGSGFTGVNAVKFNGVAAASFTVDSDTQITAAVANNSGTGAISVTHPVTGMGNSTGFFVYQKWAFATGSLIRSTPAIADDGTIYVGSNDSKLYAINPNGTQQWVFTTGTGILSSPAIGTDGTIYIGGMDSKLYAINPNGTQKWTFTSGRIISSPAIASDGTIYVGSLAPDNKLYAVNPNGTQKWMFSTGSTIGSSPAIGIDGTIYVGSQDGNSYAINPDGTQKWIITHGGSLDNNVYTSSPALDNAGNVYITSSGAQEGKFLHNRKPDSSQNWILGAGVNSSFSSPIIDIDGTIYVGQSGGAGVVGLYALNPNSSSKWSFLTSVDNIPTYPTIGNDGIIYMGSQNGKFYALNPDGTPKWSFINGGMNYLGFPIANDGTIYVGSEDGKLYAISTTSMGLANSPWPKFHANNKNTGLPNQSFISSFTPTSGAGGTTVTIYGNQFTGATAVKFNGVNAASFTVNSDTQITATVANGTTTGKISVTTGTGTVQSVADFTFLTNTWVDKGGGFGRATNRGAVALNGKIYVLGGWFNTGPNNYYTAFNSFAEYDPVNNTFTSKTSPGSLAEMGLATANGKIYVIGGCVASSGGNPWCRFAPSGATGGVSEYNPATDTWTSKTGIGLRHELGAVGLNGKIYVAGGWAGTNPTNSFDEYDPVTDSWVSKANMPFSASELSLATANNKIYAVGGCGASTGGGTAQCGTAINAFAEYDPVANTWTSKTPPPTGTLTARGATGFNGKIYVSGGWSMTGFVTAVATNGFAEYNPATDTWVTKANMSSLAELVLVSTSDRIYAIGGCSTESTWSFGCHYLPDASLNAFYEYFP